jgi:hypothetical protein
MTYKILDSLNSTPVHIIFFAIAVSCIALLHPVHADSQETTILPLQSFSNFTCTSGIGNVLLTGYFTNENTPFKVVFLKLLVLDKNWHILSTGYGNISDVKAHETKSFTAVARFSGNYSSCTIQVDNAIPK